jgi:SAM-dependent methyltransferase
VDGCDLLADDHSAARHAAVSTYSSHHVFFCKAVGRKVEVREPRAFHHNGNSGKGRRIMVRNSDPTYANQWQQWAKTRSNTGLLDSMVANELYDHTWAASAYHIRRLLLLRPGSRVLEAGSGWGRLLHAIKTHDPSLIIDAYELTPEFAERSRALLKEFNLDAGVTVKQGDLLTADLPNQIYDGVFSSRVLHYIDDKETVLRKIHASLNPGARAVIILPNSLNPIRWFTYKHAPLYSIRGMAELMHRVGFNDISEGGFGFFPPKPRLSHKSVVVSIDRALAKTPLSKIAALAYVVGTK